MQLHRRSPKAGPATVAPSATQTLMLDGPAVELAGCLRLREALSDMARRSSCGQKPRAEILAQ